MHQVIARLLADGPVVTDGGWGTLLQTLGLSTGEFPDVWNLTYPDRVGEVARRYVESGSQIILTNTFGSNRIRMRDGAAQASLREVNERGVQISLEAATGRALVFASIGPSGKMLFNDETTFTELHSAYSEQASALARAGAHGLVVETMSDLEEARIAVSAARATGLPVVACMVFDSGKAKDRTITGKTPEQVARGLTEAGADVIGANCGQGIAGFVSICRRLHAATDRPIWIKPNAGLPVMVDGAARYQTSAEEFTSFVPELLSARASFIGGCCGTSPEFISALVRRLASANNGSSLRRLSRQKSTESQPK